MIDNFTHRLIRGNILFLCVFDNDFPLLGISAAYLASIFICLVLASYHIPTPFNN